MSGWLLTHWRQEPIWLKIRKNNLMKTKQITMAFVTFADAYYVEILIFDCLRYCFRNNVFEVWKTYPRILASSRWTSIWSSKSGGSGGGRLPWIGLGSRRSSSMSSRQRDLTVTNNPDSSMSSKRWSNNGTHRMPGRRPTARKEAAPINPVGLLHLQTRKMKIESTILRRSTKKYVDVEF